MNRALRVLIWVVGKSLEIATALGIPTLIFVWVAGAIQGKPMVEALAWALVATAGVIWIVYGLLRLIEWALSMIDSVAEGIRVADLLEDWARTGHNQISLPDAATMWLGGETGSFIERVNHNIKFRLLKMAANQRLFQTTFQEGRGEANRFARADTLDLARFFRSRGWLRIR